MMQHCCNISLIYGAHIGFDNSDGNDAVSSAVDIAVDRVAGVDNCPLVTNADQNDANGDGIGDVCDTIAVDAVEGCKPGYWKQKHHFDSWPITYSIARMQPGSASYV